jgi:hypothetical protein
MFNPDSPRRAMRGSKAARVQDLGATTGEANNANNSTLMATKAELDETRAKVNELLAALRDAGLIWE